MEMEDFLIWFGFVVMLFSIGISSFCMSGRGKPKRAAVATSSDSGFNSLFNFSAKRSKTAADDEPQEEDPQLVEDPCSDDAASVQEDAVPP